MMVYNEIGKTGMKVSNLSFGASSLGGVFHGTITRVCPPVLSPCAKV